jgi:hypothetical protein
MIKALSETPIGQALLAYWEDLPLWTFGNILLIFSLLPGYLAWILGSTQLAIAASFPAWIVLFGISHALSQSANQKAPSLRDLFTGPHAVALSAWVVFVALAFGYTVSLTTIVFIGFCLLASVFLLVVPFGICMSVLFPSSIRYVWRNAFVVAIHSPVVAVGLVALAGLFGWLVTLSKGTLLLVLPALWMAIAMYATQEITRPYTRI